MCSYYQFIWIRHTELCVCSLGKYCSIFNSDFFSFCEKKTWIENIYIYFLPVPASVCSQSLEGLFFQALPPWLPKSLSAGCPHCLSVHLPQKSTRECVKLHLEACKGDNKREKKPISESPEWSNPPIPETNDGSFAKVLQTLTPQDTRVCSVLVHRAALHLIL